MLFRSHNHWPNVNCPLCYREIFNPSVATKWQRKAGGPSQGSEVLPPSRNIVEKEMECPKELVQLPHGKACLHCIMDGVKPTASNIDQLSSIQLCMLLLEKIFQLQVDIGAVHTDGDKLPHIQFCNTLL